MGLIDLQYLGLVMSAIDSKHARMPISHVVALEISQHSADFMTNCDF